MINTIKQLCFLFLVLIATVAEGQNASILENFKKDKSTSLLPDFSYAGYHSGENAIPDVRNYKVFNVLNFGAKANDDISDYDAIQATINAANANGSGIVFFPKGRFILNNDSTKVQGIVSGGSNIIFRGSGSGKGGTELFMKEALVPQNPQQMWTGRPMFTATAKGSDKEVGKVTANAAIGDTELSLSSIGNLQVGNWIALKMLNNDPTLVREELAGQQPDKTWKYIIEKGVDVCAYYQIVQINKNTIRLQAPLAYAVNPKYNWKVYQFANAEEVGVEDIAFVGNWKEKFVHHKSWKHDSGFNLFNFSRCTNAWMRNCRFTDCNVGAIVGQSANVTVMNCIVTGNAGHEAITSNHSTNVLLANLIDEASQWHSFGCANGSINTVIWRCTYPSTTCFESHASQPRNTLLDNVTGGFMPGRQGGAIDNLPNHLNGLVLWNYTQTNKPIKDFDFWPSNEIDVWFRMVKPIVIGFTGGTTFKKEGAYLESIGQKVTPKSLYEEQLLLRLKKLPKWLVEEH